MMTPRPPLPSGVYGMLCAGPVHIAIYAIGGEVWGKVGRYRGGGGGKGWICAFALLKRH